MNASSGQRKRRAQWQGHLVGATLTVLVGMLLQLHLGDGLARLSFDLPFRFSRSEVPTNLVLVLLDTKVKANLGQPTDLPLDRNFHTQLLQRLTQDGARLVLFDILFDQAHPDTRVDAAFAEAIRRQGRVVLVADYVKQLQGDSAMQGPIPPISPLAEAAAGWGLAKISPDPDFAIRKLDAGVEDYPSAGWVAALLLDSPSTQMPSARLAARWLNYYCAPDKLDAVNFDHALQPDGLPKGFFRDRIVVVGARPSVGVAGAGREEFLNPYSRFGGRFSSGPAIHAFTLLNLVRGDWISRLSPARETAICLFWGVFISVVLMPLRPWWAGGAGLVCAGLVALLAIYVQISRHVWFGWLTPAAVQTSVALAWSVGFQYAVVRRRQRQLRKAFAAYLSPYMAERIANSDFDLSLGGKEIEATVMFADLEGFTKMAETLSPAEVSRMLTAYFNRITHLILQQNATIIKYIGDSVLAAWGVPLPEAKHAERSVLAALAIIQSGVFAVGDLRLRTRIGISTGLVLAGNLGSDFRFDYSVIGDTTNLGSRLEGLNKQLGTDILISEFTQRELSGNFKLRDLGKFILAGKSRPVGIYEVLGYDGDAAPRQPWLDEFARALEFFTRADFEKAEYLMREVVELRGGKDGPAEFYIREMERLRANVLPGDSWDGVIRLDTK